ncbi:MAG: FAD-dependent oxidoreductase [Thermodesulfobacteriota bacterium]|nr:FAD-dependent oxidoreductase [Thermodesulfobacteriota bacterium]
MKTEKLKRMFEQTNIGPMTIRNRFVMSPMGTVFSSDIDEAHERRLAYYEARAKGGTGMIIVEASGVDPNSAMLPGMIVNTNDDCIPLLARYAETIKKHGARAAMQLVHGGGAVSSFISGKQPVAPSPVPPRPGGEIPRELTNPEIKEIVERFGDAALRAKKAGFDGVELHGAHAYLFVQFFTPAFNKRTDEYGGSFENRARFYMEVFQAIRDRVGPDFPVWSRINSRHFNLPDGITLEDSTRLVKMMEEVGASAVNVSCYGFGRENFANCTSIPGGLAYLAEAIKKETKLPVIAIGMMTPEAGEAVVEEGMADLISFGRGLLCDPEIANKAKEGRVDDIVPCIACMRCLQEMIFKLSPLMCSVNAALGREKESEIKPAEKKKKVMVVGGGPAGVQAARVAALRGHDVSLYEKDEEIGGQMRQASVPPGKERFKAYLDYLKAQAGKNNIKTKTGLKVTSDLVEKEKPDAVVITTGRKPLLPEIKGLDMSQVITADDVLLGKAETGETVLIIGGGLVGCETAHYLIEKGKKVTVTEILDAMATQRIPFIREAFLEDLEKSGVELLTSVVYKEVTDKGVTLTDNKGEERSIKPDTIILAAGAEAEDTLYDEIKDKVKEVYKAGDCVEPRLIAEAVREGFDIGMKL